MHELTLTRSADGILYGCLLHAEKRFLLNEHGNEPNFPRFLNKSLWPRSLTLCFEPFRFWLQIRGDIRIRKTTPRIGESRCRQDCLEIQLFSNL